MGGISPRRERFIAQRGIGSRECGRSSKDGIRRRYEVVRGEANVEDVEVGDVVRAVIGKQCAIGCQQELSGSWEGAIGYVVQIDLVSRGCSPISPGAQDASKVVHSC